jgi:hypothetical protein
MPLSHTVDTLDGLPEATKALYVEQSSGGFALDLDPPWPDVSKLQGALETERQRLKKAESHLKKYEGINPDDVRSMREQLEGMKDKQVLDDEGVNVLIAKKTQSLKDDYERKLQALTHEKTAWEGKATEAETKRRRDKARRELMEAAAAVKVLPTAIPDAVERALKTFTVDDSDHLVGMSGETILYGKSGVDPLSPKEFFHTLKTEAPHLFGVSAGGGAAGISGGTFNGQDLSKLSPADRLTAFREANQR